KRRRLDRRRFSISAGMARELPGAVAPRLFVPYHGPEALLVYHLDAQLPGLCELAAGAIAGQDIAGLFGHAAGDLAAEGLDEGGGLVAGICGERAGEDEGHAAEAGVAQLLAALEGDAGVPQQRNLVPGLG